MVVYPLKWVPYLFIIGGILAILIGEGDVAWNLCVIGIGVAWLVIKKKYFDIETIIQAIKPVKENDNYIINAIPKFKRKKDMYEYTFISKLTLV